MVGGRGGGGKEDFVGGAKEAYVVCCDSHGHVMGGLTYEHSPEFQIRPSHAVKAAPMHNAVLLLRQLHEGVVIWQ